MFEELVVQLRVAINNIMVRIQKLESQEVPPLLAYASTGTGGVLALTGAYQTITDCELDVEPGRYLVIATVVTNGGTTDVNAGLAATTRLTVAGTPQAGLVYNALGRADGAPAAGLIVTSTRTWYVDVDVASTLLLQILGTGAGDANVSRNDCTLAAYKTGYVTT